MASGGNEPAVPRAAAVPHSMARAYFAPGKAEVDSSSTDGDTDALGAGAAFEGVGDMIGGGIKLDFYLSDDDLIPAGPGVETTAFGASVFPHVTFRPGADKFRVPIRVGPEFILHAVKVDGSPGSADFDWVSYGMGLEVEPEYDFFRDDKSALSIYGGLHGGVGLVFISGPVDDYDSNSATFGAEIGLRYEIAAFLVSAGFSTRTTTYDQSDPEAGFTVPETDFTFRGFFISAGARW
jgi:hypothetical protein